MDHSTRGIKTLTALAAAALLLLLMLGSLNTFNFRALQPGDAGALLLFYAVIVLIFLMLLALLVLFARNILKLYADQRSRVLGSRLRSRMLVGALVLSFAPTLFMFLFSYGLMNRSIDRWFSQPVAQLRGDSTRIALELSHYVAQNARAEAESLARSGAVSLELDEGDQSALVQQMRTHRITLEGGFAVVYRDGVPVASYDLPKGNRPASVRSWLATFDPRAEAEAPAQAAAAAKASVPLSDLILAASRRSDEPVLTVADTEYGLGEATTASGGIIVVALPMPNGLGAVVDDIGQGARQYWSVYRQRRTVRTTYLLLLFLLTALTFFASSWLALFLSKQITRPVEALADAMDEIAAGDYRQRITLSATEELGDLIGSFNQMAADLEESRNRAESAALQLSAANRAIDERRHELELILETIPSGVVVLDTGRRILQVNRAFIDLCPQPEPPRKSQENGTVRNGEGKPGNLRLTGKLLEEVIPPEIVDEVLRLERRAQRMGVAGTELELRGTAAHGPIGASLSVSMTIAVLELGRDRQGQARRGSILVVEDVSEVLQAQRQVAWKEVAQRVAHEIKNPLTPILLSAERIRRHVDRSTPDSLAVIRRCSEVILGSVESMRTLVDQFAVLAQFPAAQPRPASLNTIVEAALMLFQDRLLTIRIESRLAQDLPPVMADPEALKRAIANLIDNAAEAMQDSLLRVLTLETRLSERSGMAELIVSDTGPGLNPEVRERLFLPYFSTKQRGTGLGLAITAKIVQDHHGAIRAEQRTPVGARFIIELPFADALTAPSQMTNQESALEEGRMERDAETATDLLEAQPAASILAQPLDAPVQEQPL